ncbi:hypothetical protein HB364_13945 [Pseudoflavitalea sp. X16]|uniref:hypothetical protein n=1 Tax=Paraflavitalea devenefica TaxID=2716334 RepID=UPI00141E3890|nr:hypothetical protein [Paraflavitalea devenefica]NII26191.1 hypothetical protein [Paraflavitalea devenefica]
MGGINRVRLPKYPDKEQKLNFFVDYFNYFLHFSGLMAGLELDNPLSHTEKFIFQLQTNVNNHQCIIYLKNHAEKLLAYPPSYTRKFPAYQPVRQALEAWVAAGGGHNYIKLQAPQLLAVFQALQLELSQQMMESACDQIITQVLCEHSPEEHVKGITFYTQIIATELIFRRKSKEEVRVLFNEIMGKDYRDFHYPPHIKTDEEKQQYFATKDVYKTLKAIIDFYQQPDQGWYVAYTVEDLILNKKDTFIYGNCLVCSPSNFAMKGLRARLAKSKDPAIKGFLSKRNIAVCEVKVNSVKASTAHMLATVHAVRTINYINKVLDRGVRLNTANYFFSTDRVNYGYSLKGLGQPFTLQDFDIKVLEDNAYQFFAGKNFASESAFLQYEDIYVDARYREQTAELWRYLEVMLGKGKAKKFLSGAILLDEKTFRTSRLSSYLKNIIDHFNSNANDLGITFEEQVAYVKRATNLKGLAKKIQSIFFKQAYQQMVDRLTKQRLQRIRQHYYSLLEEAYELRNADIHTGYSHDRAKVKLFYSFPILVNRMRWVLFSYIRKHPTMTLPQIITQIEKDILAKFGPFAP